MSGNVFLGFLLIVIGIVCVMVGVKKRGKQFLAELKK